MKLIKYFALWLTFSYANSFASQINDFVPTPPCYPRKAEMVIITSVNSDPICYCKIDNTILLGLPKLKTDKIEMEWYLGYLEKLDSLKLIDAFDNQTIDQMVLFGELSQRTKSKRATYYLIKKKLGRKEYKIKKRKFLINAWWSSQFIYSKENLILVNDCR